MRARNGVDVAVVSLLGRVFMRPVDCPWTAADRVLAALPPEVKVILVDFHAEATSDKQLMGRYLDGRCSAVLGTHTHVPTADETILPAGTAFQCDVGMTGPLDSVLGRRVERVLESTLTFNPTHFEVAHGDVQLLATLVDVDPETGKATAIERIRLKQAEVDQLAAAAPGAVQSRDRFGRDLNSVNPGPATAERSGLARLAGDRYAPPPFQNSRDFVHGK